MDRSQYGVAALEEQVIQQGLEGVQIALVSPFFCALEYVTVPNTNIQLFLVSEDGDDEMQSICGGDTLAVAASGDSVPVMFDVETGSLD